MEGSEVKKLLAEQETRFYKLIGELNFTLVEKMAELGEHIAQTVKGSVEVHVPMAVKQTVNGKIDKIKDIVEENAKVNAEEHKIIRELVNEMRPQTETVSKIKSFFLGLGCAIKGFVKVLLTLSAVAGAISVLLYYFYKFFD